MKRTAVAVAALLVAPAAAAQAAPKRLPACLTFADAAGDAVPAGVTAATALTDPALDITKVRIAIVGKALVTSVTLDRFADRPAASLGGRYLVEFTVDNIRLGVYYKAGPVRGTEANVFYQEGVYVNDEPDDSVIVKGSVKGNVVSISVPLPALKSAAGRNIMNEEAYGISVSASNTYVAQDVAWDRAGTDDSFVYGGACK